MILETDKALLSLLRTEVLGEAPVAVAFDAPNRPWIQQVKGLVVNLYLYDIRENMQRREVMFTEIRDDNGKLLERRPPPRRYDLYYALTVWAPKVPLEHQVLACVLAGLSEYETIPAKHLPDQLADSGHVVLLSVADGMKRAMLQNLAGELKMSLEVVVTVPIFGKMPLPLAAPVSQPVTLTVNGAERVAARPAAAGGAPAKPGGGAGPAGAAPGGAAGGRPGGAAPAAGGAAPAGAGAAAPAGVGPNAVRQAQQQAMVAAAGAAQGAGASSQAGGAAAGGAPGQRPAQPGQAAGKPPNPLALAQAALAQAAQSQAMLAQATAALVKVLTAASGASGGQPQAGPGVRPASGTTPSGAAATGATPTNPAASAADAPADGAAPSGQSAKKQPGKGTKGSGDAAGA